MRGNGGKGVLQSAAFLGGIGQFRSRTGRNGAYVENIHAVLHHQMHLAECRFCIGNPALFVERVGGKVQDSHHHGTIHNQKVTPDIERKSHLTTKI